SFVHAYRFAAKAHLGQTITGCQLPYLTHVTITCMEVIAALRGEPAHNPDLAVQCALLHDTIEDTDITYEYVKLEFGKGVTEGLLALSKDPSLKKELQLKDSLQRIRIQPREIWMVKLADRISNLHNHPPGWTRKKIASYKQDALLIYNTLKDASPLLSK